MTLRQKILKWFYPALIAFNRLKGSREIKNASGKAPATPFYDLSVELTNGSHLPLEKLKGKKVLIVNTASDCGYTAQFAELQKLYEYSKEDLEIIGFPSNDFKDQEKKSDREIEQFCQKNYGVRFPLTKKAAVCRGDGQHPVFQWLTHADLNGWNNQPPAWNFSKYLISEDGVLTHYFDPSVSPLSESVLDAIHHDAPSS